MIKFLYRKLVPFNLRERIYNKRSFGVSNINNITAVDLSLTFFKQRKCLFIHIPKSAGVSVYHGLFNRDSFGHIKFQEYEEKEGLEKLFKFCFVRHPIYRCLSAYHYLKAGGRGYKLDLVYQKKLTDAKSFEDFVLNYLHKTDVLEMEHFVPQVDWVRTKSGVIEIDFFGKFESLNKDYSFICEKLGVKNDVLPQLNRLPNKQKHILSNEIKQKIFNVYQDDFIAFNYCLNE